MIQATATTSMTDVGHMVVGWVGLLLLVVLLAAYVPWALAGLMLFGAATALTLRLFRHTDADDDESTTADDVWLSMVPAQYGDE